MLLVVEDKRKDSFIEKCQNWSEVKFKKLRIWGKIFGLCRRIIAELACESSRLDWKESFWIFDWTEIILEWFFFMLVKVPKPFWFRSKEESSDMERHANIKPIVALCKQSYVSRHCCGLYLEKVEEITSFQQQRGTLVFVGKKLLMELNLGFWGR